MAEWCYNTTTHSATGMSPFEAFYGHKPRLLLYVCGTTANETMDQQLRTRDEIMGLLKENLQKAQQRMKHFADRKNPTGQKELSQLILEKVGSVAYKPHLLIAAKIHNVFHVSWLKKKLGENVTALPSLPLVDKEGNIKPKLEAI
ncbi:uncharacterized protein LOC122316178 [Carya illinoinensis]|uniref:uncharacterized protein LOC122316178 n=1 Tax=Carya illinoinensis TaxID=32201 RepID=UPI001C728EAA|nr:uncharacterized protein LOC122316178 [Carya illinoinensis]